MPDRPIRPRVLFLLLLLCSGLCACTSIFLFPDRVHYLPNRALGTPAEDVWIAAPDGKDLHALYLPAQVTPRASLLYLHGNAENLSSHVHAVGWLPAQGYSVLALDYRGFGRSQGKASVDALHEDAEAALAWLAARDADTAGPLIVYGQSLGASVAIRLVAGSTLRERIAAVIAESAFASYRGITREKLAQLWLTWPLQWPLSLLVSDRNAAIDVVDRISPIPLLLIHGERDVIVDPSHSRRLYEAASEPKELWLIPQGAHINATRREPVRARFLDFLNVATEGFTGNAGKHPPLNKRQELTLERLNKEIFCANGCARRHRLRRARSAARPLRQPVAVCARKGARLSLRHEGRQGSDRSTLDFVWQRYF